MFYAIILVFCLTIGSIVSPKNECTFPKISEAYLVNYGEPLKVHRSQSLQLGWKKVVWVYEDRIVVFYRNRYKSSKWYAFEE